MSHRELSPERKVTAAVEARRLRGLKKRPIGTAIAFLWPYCVCTVPISGEQQGKENPIAWRWAMLQTEQLCDNLNSLLRGELSATETYQQAMEQVAPDQGADEL